MKRLLGVLIGVLLLAAGCRQVALYERLQNIKGGEWYTNKPLSYNFNITDTTALYNVFLVVRHTNAYPYRNIWLDVGLQQPEDTVRHQRFELALAASDHWLGTGMDDVYEHRAKLFTQPVRFTKAGDIVFTISHIMRQDPLPGLLQVGVRVEPVVTAGTAQ